MKNPPGFLDRETFETLLKHAVIPTFDLILDIEGEGILLARRTIAPYKNQWALPGLRMMKGERRDDVLRRIAQQEAGIKINAKTARIIGQFDGVFTTEHNRQDISTCYAVTVPATKLTINAEHFSTHKFITSAAEIPDNIGAMYKHYLLEYFSKR